jgi:hypothetical protein
MKLCKLSIKHDNSVVIDNGITGILDDSGKAGESKGIIV